MKLVQARMVLPDDNNETGNGAMVPRVVVVSGIGMGGAIV